MSTPLNVLIIEDSARDALLIKKELRKHWTRLVFKKVQSGPDLGKALARQQWDCVLSEMILPGFSAMEAITIMKNAGIETPFIVVSGSANIADALNLLKSGAHEFVSKENIACLVPALHSARQKNKEIVRQRESERALRRSEKRLSDAQRIAKLGHYSLDITSGTWTASAQLMEIFGIEETFVQDVQSWLGLIHPDSRQEMKDYLEDHVLTRHKKFDKIYPIVSVQSGLCKWVHGLGVLKLDDNQQPVELFGTIQDVTETKAGC